MILKLQNHLKISLSFLATCLAFLLPMPSVAQTQVSFAWQPNTEPDIAGYRLFHRMEGEKYAYYDPDWEGPDTECTFEIFDEDVPHFFVLRAFDTEGLESSNSDEACFGCPTDYRLNTASDLTTDNNLDTGENTGCFVDSLF